ncbi:MAG: hypothetical protein ACYS9C_19345 [Planctomycetota bacterium]
MITKTWMAIFGIVAAFLLSSCSHFDNDQSHANKAFPAKMPLEKPSDRKLSAAMERMYDVWNPHEDRGNEFFSNFKYSRLERFSREPNVSRREPSKVIRVDGTYYVYYTCRRTEGPPAGPDKATGTIPSRDWDLAEIWYATSKDGFRWKERGPAVKRPVPTENSVLVYLQGFAIRHYRLLKERYQTLALPARM